MGEPACDQVSRLPPLYKRDQQTTQPSHRNRTSHFEVPHALALLAHVSRQRRAQAQIDSVAAACQLEGEGRPGKAGALHHIEEGEVSARDESSHRMSLSQLRPKK